MSIRRLYKTVPVDQRVCSYYKCPSGRIRRNIARTNDGRLWHYGCLNDAHEEKYRCLECYMTFDATEASFQEGQVIHGDEIREQPKPICPNCGCSNLKKGAFD